METQKVTISKIIFSNDDTGFKVLNTRTLAGKNLIVTGEFGPEIIPESVVSFHGDFKSHPKYGHQFKAYSYTIEHNAQELASIRLFLDNVAENIGPERSEAIIAYFGMETLTVIEHQPQRLMEVPGIGKVLSETIKNAWHENREKWNEERVVYSLRAFLGSLGLRERKIKKVLAHFGGREVNAEEHIKKNPYCLVELDGFGFTTVDFIARKLGISEDSPDRFKAFILYLMNIISPSNGHLFLTNIEILEQIKKYCDENNTKFLDRTVSDFDVYQKVTELTKEEKIIYDENLYVYSKRQFEFEKNSAALLATIMEEKSDLIFLTKDKITEFIETFEHEHSISLSEEQKQALYFFSEEKVFVITGLPGTGKCLGINTPIMMFDGTTKKVQDIKIGDKLMGDDSFPRTVLSTATGKDNLFKITPTKGNSFIINSAHILSLKSNGYTKLVKKGNIIDIDYNQYKKLNGNHTHHLKLYRVPLNFPNKKVPIDPYLFGYWLGDGASACSRITSSSHKVLNYLKNLLKPLNLSLKKVAKYDYSISCNRNTGLYKKLKNKLNPNLFLNFLRKFNLINNKHIPDLYRLNNKEKRLKLLAGILDSDGYYDKKSKIYELSFKSKKLTKDVVFLIRSLGFAVYPKKVKKKWNSFSKGKKYKGENFYYVMSISGKNIEKIPSIIKKAYPRKQKKDVLVTGFKIKSAGFGNYYGFEIDGNGRFLLGDFTVTHNTTILKAIVSLAQKLGLRLTCMTPTGISAKKLSEVIQYEAFTIHRRLGYRGNQWAYNEIEKFDTDVVIIDETSMVDQEVLFRLLSALKNRTHIIFVGDHNQLPSVGAGNVLRELIFCEQLPVVRLEKIFRQEEASDIIKASHRIIHGDTNLELFKDDPAADIYFLRIRDISEIERLVVALADKFKAERRQFQIITARNTGPLGIEILNNVLQSALNPPTAHLNEIKVGNFIVRVGDRIIVKKNDYENDIYNGDIGKVISIASGKILIKIDDRLIELSVEEIQEQIKLAYSITCHKAQGLEYQTVILVFINQFGRNMLQRNLLYTALTRAKKKIIVLGHGSAIERAIENTSVIRRNTLLGQRIKACLLRKKNPSSCTLPLEPENYQGALKQEEPLLLENEDCFLTDLIER